MDEGVHPQPSAVDGAEVRLPAGSGDGDVELVLGADGNGEGEDRPCSTDIAVVLVVVTADEEANCTGGQTSGVTELLEGNRPPDADEQGLVWVITVVRGKLEVPLNGAPDTDTIFMEDAVAGALLQARGLMGVGM